MIRIENMEFRYPDGAFRLGVRRLELPSGSTTALIGPSGSGKTTLLSLIAGILPPDNGRVESGGVELRALTDRERREYRITRIGLIFQEFELLDYLSVLDNVLLPYRISRSLKLDGAVRARAGELLARVGLEALSHRRPRELSQGERQRVALCRAVVVRPELLLADEPTGNLDPRNTAIVLEILREYVERDGATLVTATHDRQLVGGFDRVLDFGDFRTWADAAPAALDGRGS